METCAEEMPTQSTENTLPVNNTEEKELQDKTKLPQPQQPVKKSKKEDKSRKENKHVEQFMKSLNSLPNIDEKFTAVCKKYTQTAEENKTFQFYIKLSDKRYALLLKEKDQLQHEFNKTILVKSKLENLCRELQKQNKAIKEESLLKIREEEERRKETQAKFQSTLSDFTSLLQQNNDKNAKLRDDNISMSEKFKSVVQQYQLREQQVDKMAKQMSLESQLADAKLQKASLEHQAERERIMAEMEQLKVTVAQYRAKIMELQSTEIALRGQLAVYTDKYDEFQNALVKSNQVFGGFKEQMEMMSKKIKKLEKESLSWKNRWETSQTALLDMCGERQASEERAAGSARQLHHMQSLCRTLQGERTLLLNTLKEHNIERPPLPPTPAPPPPAPAPPANNDKVDAMAANCAQLRQSLAHLQSQLNVLTTKKEESPKPEKPKKSKSKKNKGDKQAKVEEKVDVKETESDESSITKELTEEASTKDATISNEVTVSNEVKVSNEETVSNEKEVEKEEFIGEKTLENLIEAISSANINISDIDAVAQENGNENQNTKVEDNNSVTKENGNVIGNDEVKEINCNIESNLNVSHEISCNEEISHIPEIKPISESSA